MASNENGTKLDPRFRWLLGVLGLGLLLAGTVATFVSSNDVGTAALVAGGFGLAALAYLGERVTRVKYGEFEADLERVKKAETLVKAAAVAEGAGATEHAEKLRSEALETLGDLKFAGRSYEELRSSMPAGWQRTQRMEDIVAEARDLARERGVTIDQVRELAASDAEGDRLMALGAMEEVASRRDFDILVPLVEVPKSPFEHYHALRVASQMVPELDEHQRQRLVNIISQQREEHRLASDSDRRRLIDRILTEIGDQVPPPPQAT